MVLLEVSLKKKKKTMTVRFTMWLFTCWARCIKKQIKDAIPAGRLYDLILYVTQMKTMRWNRARREDLTTVNLHNLLESFTFPISSTTCYLIFLPGSSSHFLFYAIMGQRKLLTDNTWIGRDVCLLKKWGERRFWLTKVGNTLWGNLEETSKDPKKIREN